MPDRILTRDFSSACMKFHGDMAYLRGLMTTPQGQTFHESIPIYREHEWGYEDNCTALAFNMKACGGIQPGYLATGVHRYNKHRPKGLDGYSADIHQDLKKDGLVYLGDKLADTVGKGVPAALFLLSDSMGEDYHWYALRRVFNNFTNKCDSLVWVEKFAGVDPVADDGNSTIFGRARQRRYEVFGGYYAIPDQVLGH